MAIKTIDLVEVAVTAAIFAVTLFFASAFQIVPGWSSFFLPAIWLATFPFWFGLPGVIGMAIGSFVGAGIFKGLGILAGGEAFGTLIETLAFWLIVPAGIGLLKSRKDMAYYVGNVLWFNILGSAFIFWYLVAVGIIPASIILPIYIFSTINNFILMFTVSIILLRVVTPYLKRSGIYKGTYRERKLMKPKEMVPTVSSTPGTMMTAHPSPKEA